MAGDLFSGSNKPKKRKKKSQNVKDINAIDKKTVSTSDKIKKPSSIKHKTEKSTNQTAEKKPSPKNKELTDEVPASAVGYSLKILQHAARKKQAPKKTVSTSKNNVKPKNSDEAISSRKHIIELQPADESQNNHVQQSTNVPKRKNEKSDDAPIFSVREITNKIKKNLENNFTQLSIRGEVSKPSFANSGHIYFNIKDSHAVLSCVIWKGVAQKMKYKPIDGDDVIVKGSITVFALSGKYQLAVTEILPVGKGALYYQYEMLKIQLGKEGLFDSSRKKKIPTLPKCIGVVSAATGAAITDIIRVIHERFPYVEILLSPSLVQGEKAASEIVKALKLLDDSGIADVIIIGRGGGSFEDLIAFNDENVVRTVAACKTPVIAAIGHERDFTLAELASDIRAATPSQAGEFAVPVYSEKMSEINTMTKRLQNVLSRQIEVKKRLLVNLTKMLNTQNPVKQMRLKEQHIDGLSIRLNNAIVNKLKNSKQVLSNLAQHLKNQLPSKMLMIEIQRSADLADKLHSGITGFFNNKKQVFMASSDKLKILSPFNVLERGYSLTTDVNGKIIKNQKEVQEDQQINTTLAHGKIISIVKSSDMKGSEPK